MSALRGRNSVTLKIETEEGIYGLGDATLNGREVAVANYLSEHVIPCIIGRDPFQTEDIWQYLYRGAYWRRGPVTMSAIGAVDVALWDIKGKALNMPVYNLLGGKSREGVLVYAHANGGTLSRPSTRSSGRLTTATSPSARRAVYPGWHRPTECLKKTSSTSQPKRACLRRVYGRQKNICGTFRDYSQSCATDAATMCICSTTAIIG